jgi:hypothetical protein
MLKSKAWVIAVVAAAALLPAPPVHASELVKLAKLLVTGKRAPAATEAAKPSPPPAARPDAAERWAPARSAEPAAGERAPVLNLRGEAAPEPAAPAAPSADWQGQDRGESAPSPRPVPAETNPNRGDRFEAASAPTPRRSLA